MTVSPKTTRRLRAQGNCYHPAAAPVWGTSDETSCTYESGGQPASETKPNGNAPSANPIL